MSTADQDLAGQENRLEKAGAIRIFTDVVSGGKFERPRLIAERTRDGIVAARKRGSIPDRPDVSGEGYCIVA